MNKENNICDLKKSQSLFYWNPFCNFNKIKKTATSAVVAILILLESFLQWHRRNLRWQIRLVTILILLESFLQYDKGIRRNNKFFKSQSLFYWNPFCNTTICSREWHLSKVSQSLFYWNPFCNKTTASLMTSASQRRNPYFIGILSAIGWWGIYTKIYRWVAILILLESFLQYDYKKTYLTLNDVAILILLESFLQ